MVVDQMPANALPLYSCLDVFMTVFILFDESLLFSLCFSLLCTTSSFLQLMEIFNPLPGERKRETRDTRRIRSNITSRRVNFFVQIPGILGVLIIIIILNTTHAWRRKKPKCTQQPTCIAISFTFQM